LNKKIQMKEKRIKFVKKANMWVHICWKGEKGKMKQEMKWFHTKEEAEAFADSNNKEDNSK